jgi:hypothetical protein
MEDLFIKGEKNTFFIPTVQFSAQAGICELGGESYLENTFEFYQPLLNWLREYMTTTKKPITFNFSLTYFNTASSRSILDLLNVLKEYKTAGGSVQVNWYLQAWDEDMEQEIEDFSADADLPIHIQQF